MKAPATPSSDGLVDLFGDPIAPTPIAKPAGKPAGRAGQVAAAPVAAAAVEVAYRLNPHIYLGTSSWSFPGWDGLVYSGEYSEAKLARDGLPAYAQHPLMRAAGIDRTFYGPIAESDYQRYAGQVPAHFRFLVKAPMAITSSYVRADDGTFGDSPHFFDSEYAINEFIAPCTAGLAAKAGPMVFQFPPQGRVHTREPDQWINRLYRFLRRLPPGFLYAVEIRDPALMTERFFKCLNETNVRYCLSGHEKMCSPIEQIAAMQRVLVPGALVVRWNLHFGFRYEDAKARYEPFDKLVDADPDGRTSIAKVVRAAVDGGFPAYVIVGNKAEGSAPLTIEALAAHIVDAQ
jgi:uncharacterized protein YecE (DUF72 family)